MVGITMALVVLIGIPLGVILHNTSGLGLYPDPGFSPSSTRSSTSAAHCPSDPDGRDHPGDTVPVGTTIGIPAAIVPMTVPGSVLRRLVQNALREVRSDVTDMGQVSGGSTLQVIRTVQLSEALPAIAGALTVNTIAMIDYSAIAGSIGAGGIGNLAITYGYNRFDDNIMIATAISLIITIAVVQFVGGPRGQKPSPAERSLNDRPDHPAFGHGTRHRDQEEEALAVDRGRRRRRARRRRRRLLWRSSPTRTSRSAPTLPVATWSTDIAAENLLSYIATDIAPDHGITIEPVKIDNLIEINRAVDAGTVAGNFFEHQPFLNDAIAANGFQLTLAAPTFTWDPGHLLGQIPQLGPGTRRRQDRAARDDPPTGHRVVGPRPRQTDHTQARQGHAGGSASSTTSRPTRRTTSSFRCRSVSWREACRRRRRRGPISDVYAAGLTEQQILAREPAPKGSEGGLVVSNKHIDDPNVVKLIDTFKDPRIAQFLQTTPTTS